MEWLPESMSPLPSPIFFPSESRRSALFFCIRRFGSDILVDVAAGGGGGAASS